MAKLITMDGYEFELVAEIPTTMNTMCIYEVTKIDSEDCTVKPEYFLASAKYRDQYFQMHLLYEIKANIMPQHYEAFFDDKLTAILMARNVALESYLEKQNYELEEAEKKLHIANECLAKFLKDYSLRIFDEYRQFYNDQDESRKHYAQLAEKLIDELEGK